MPYLLCLGVSFWVSLASTQAGFQPYPGAQSSAPWFRKYAAETRAQLRQIDARADLQVWVTSDSFDKVLAVYSRLGKERAEFAETLAADLRATSGRDVKATHVIFDSAESPIASTNYVSIQRPVIVSFEPLVVHDVTQIALYTHRK